MTIIAHVQDSVDCPCGPRVTAPCTACPDPGEDADAICWLCGGTGRIDAHAWDKEKIRRSVAERGLIPKGYAIEHKEAA